MKELRGRMRGPRAFAVLTGYLAALGGFTTLFYMATTTASLNTTGQFNGGEIGRFLFSTVVAMELFLVAFITPAFTASAISGEREHQTFDLLRTTLLPEGALVIGKLFSALAYIFLLLLAAVPLQSIAFLFGGVDLSELVVVLVTLLTTGVFLGTLGVYFSTTLRRTLRANIATYVTTMGFIIVTALILIVLNTVFEGMLENNIDPISSGEEWPFLILRGLFVSLNPIATLLVSRDYLVEQQTLYSIEYLFDNGETVTLPSPWIIFAAIYLVMSFVVFKLTTRHLKKVDEY
jgi:ABC-type transport system involved in multi-copper enzyme maturation permease subunit